MLVVYDSRTGNVDRFVRKLNMPSLKLAEDTSVDEPYVLITYTTGFGQVPDQVQRFVDKHSNLIRGISASGNRNWGPHFAGSADLLSARYGIPVLTKFELSGTEGDVQRFREGVKRLAAY